jgi:hypothetical protein
VLTFKHIQLDQSKIKHMNLNARALEQFFYHAPLKGKKSTDITRRTYQVLYPFLTQREREDISYDLIINNNDRVAFDKVMLRIYRRLKKLKEFQ